MEIKVGKTTYTNGGRGRNRGLKKECCRNAAANDKFCGECGKKLTKKPFVKVGR